MPQKNHFNFDKRLFLFINMDICLTHINDIECNTDFLYLYVSNTLGEFFRKFYRSSSDIILNFILR